MVDADKLTAFPLNAKRLDLKRIDHTFIDLCVMNALHEIDNPNSEIRKQIVNLFDYYSPEYAINGFKEWVDVFSSRKSKDKENGNFGSLNEDEDENSSTPLLNMLEITSELLMADLK